MLIVLSIFMLLYVVAVVFLLAFLSLCVVFLSRCEFVCLIIPLYLFCRWKSYYQDGMVGIPLATLLCLF